MLLSDRVIKTLKPAAKAKKYADGEGLFLFINTSGTKSWRFRYRNISGKEKEMTFGTYPEVSLIEAREKKLQARQLIRANKDPITDKKEKVLLADYVANNLVKHVANEWVELQKDRWTKRHAQKIQNRLKYYIFPKIGDKPINEVSALEFLHNIIRPVERDGKTLTSHDLFEYCGAIFRYAVLTKRISYNPLADLKGTLKPHKTTHLPAIDISELPLFMSKLEQSTTLPIHKLAVKLLLLTFVRQGELRKAKWEYFNWEKKLWYIPAELMKTRKEHLVPLSGQAIKLLTDIRAISAENTYLFPSQHNSKYPYMNENAINRIIHSLGYKDKFVGHGFRSIASTTLNELGHSSDVIEKQLAHSETKQVRAAYNRAEYLPQRIEMMQFWADYLDTIIYK